MLSNYKTICKTELINNSVNWKLKSLIMYYLLRTLQKLIHRFSDVSFCNWIGVLATGLEGVCFVFNLIIILLPLNLLILKYSFNKPFHLAQRKDNLKTWVRKDFNIKYEPKVYVSAFLISSICKFQSASVNNYPCVKWHHSITVLHVVVHSESSLKGHKVIFCS